MSPQPTCEKDGQPLQEDLTFRAQLAAYGIPRTRYACVAGHSVYHDYQRGREARRPARTCALCGEPIGRGRRKCELCRGQRWR